tara:strand:+ start:1642 stop:2787 length:1146 start_codon:yes stop_codon:yes gene_type:complete
MKNKFLPIISFIAFSFLFLTSCSDDDDVVSNVVTPPSNYTFEKDGVSTVSFSGQTTRLKMAIELYNGMKDNTMTKAKLTEMFKDGTGFAGADVSNSTKQVRSKTFSSSNGHSATVVNAFDGWIDDFTGNVIPNWTTTAADGTAGKMTDSKRTVYINAKGHELTQLFTKGLIGGMALDQIVNGYLAPVKITDAAKAANDAGTPYKDGKNYTALAHYWDEGFGYLYGLEADYKNPTLADNGDVLLNKYTGKVDGSSHPGIAKKIYDAFVMGRAAIDAKNYTVMDAQAKIIKVELSKVIMQKAADYLNGYVSKKADGNMADAIHALSEGYGFVMSLQATNDGTGKPYFSATEVNDMLTKLDNFWTVTDADCSSMATTILAAMPQ